MNQSAARALKTFRAGTEKNSVSWIMTMAVIFCFTLLLSQSIMAQEKTETARPSVNGPLHVSGTVLADQARVELSGIVISLRQAASGIRSVYTMEILDFNGMEDDYSQILYDRVPTLPQNLNRDFGILRHLWVNIANRAGRSRYAFEPVFSAIFPQTS